MSAVSILRAVLVANAPLTSVVPVTEIISGIIPQGTPLPCLALTDVVGTEVPTIDASSPDVLVDKRVQVTVMSANYVQKKQIIELVRKAANYQRGELDGFKVVSIRRVLEGPDFSATEIGVEMQSIDFSVVFYEPN